VGVKITTFDIGVPNNTSLNIFLGWSDDFKKGRYQKDTKINLIIITEGRRFLFKLKCLRFSLVRQCLSTQDPIFSLNLFLTIREENSRKNCKEIGNRIRIKTIYFYSSFFDNRQPDCCQKKTDIKNSSKVVFRAYSSSPSPSSV
jgi:hypothetical protein